MRLVCPNCDAEYEVEDAAIPPSGRDVQCSNCGHAWFQLHPDDLAPQDGDLTSDLAFGAEPDGADAEELTWTATEGEDLSESESEPLEVEPSELSAEDAAAATVDWAAAATRAEAPAASRGVDDGVLSVLREEAAREVAARRAEAPPPALETQTEMQLAAAVASVVNPAVARVRREPEPEGQTYETAHGTAQTSRPRRDLLPAIEEINSTLRASSGRPGEEAQSLVAAEAAQAARTSFGSGFVTLLLLAVILLALYILAPLISDKFPGLAAVMARYVEIIDAVRIWLDDQIKSLIGMLRGLEGSAKG